MNEPLPLLGTVPAVERLREDIRAAARTDAKVLITGESGVGKEVVARNLHASSRRAARPLVTVNCAAVSETLLESELFGHARGSFTGAYRDRAGLLETAHGGTVFMDEIGEMGLRMQGLLLRFLEVGEIQRVGSDRPTTRVDVRVIAATNRSLLDGVAANTFRQDLYYRLNVLHLFIPPLRDRRADIPLMVRYFAEEFARRYQRPVPTFANDAMDALIMCDWPGNIRQLRNVIERIMVRADAHEVRRADLPLQELQLQAPAPPEPAKPSSPARPDTAASLFALMVDRGESFWTAVYAPFMAHDLTRDDVRRVVSLGLERTAGNYRILTELFNMSADDYKRFLAFLRKYQCRVAFQQFRAAAAGRVGPDDPRGVPSSSRYIA